IFSNDEQHPGIGGILPNPVALLIFRESVFLGRSHTELVLFDDCPTVGEDGDRIVGTSCSDDYRLARRESVRTIRKNAHHPSLSAAVVGMNDEHRNGRSAGASVERGWSV